VRPATDPYDEALRTILQIPALADEASGAERVLRCLFKPSFHPECSISLVERDGAEQMTIRIPARSVWSLIQARAGSPTENPVTDWVKPPVSVEQVATRPPASLRAAIDAVEQKPLPEVPAFGIDGMSVDVVLWRQGFERSFSLWFGRFDDGDERHRLVRSVLETAIDVARWGQSRTGLHAVRAYVLI
jgi:hypothetical protein